MSEPHPFESILKGLDENIVLPYFELGMLKSEWPDSYLVEIDSSPYYGAGDGFFHPSTHAVDTEYNNTGARFLYYMYHPEFKDKLVFERRTIQSELTLAMGSSLHGILQAQLKMMGLTTDEDIEVEYVNRTHWVRGRLDVIVTLPDGRRIPVEFKTQNPWANRKQKDIKHEWDAQLSIALDNLGFSWGILLVAQSGWPYEFKEYRVNRNDKLLSETYGKFDYVRESIQLNRPPRHCCALNSPEMNKCPARYVCWLSKEGDQG